MGCGIHSENEYATSVDAPPNSYQPPELMDATLRTPVVTPQVVSAGLCHAWTGFYSRFCSSRHTPTQWLVTGDWERKDGPSADANRLKDITPGQNLENKIRRKRGEVKKRERWGGQRASKGKGAGSDRWLTCPCLDPLLPLIIIIPSRRQQALCFAFTKRQYRVVRFTPCLYTVITKSESALINFAQCNDSDLLAVYMAGIHLSIH